MRSFWYIYLGGAILHSILFMGLICGHCFGIDKFPTYHVNVLIQAMAWPVTFLGLVMTGNPIFLIKCNC